MSLHHEPAFTIPEQTARVARAAFRRPTLPMRLADELGAIVEGVDFSPLFSPVGQPAISPVRLALVTLLQFTEDLGDRDAADAVRSRIDWKYCLGLELEDEGFDFSVLSEFRSRLLEAGAEQVLFERILDVCRQRKWLAARGRQRTDSTHVLGAIRTLNRLELVVETMHTALDALAVAAPDFVRQAARPEWVERYGARGDDHRLPKAKAEREALLEAVGSDGYALLEEIDSGPEWLRQVPAVFALRRIWLEQFEVVDGKCRARGPQDQPPPSRRTTSPHDVEARFATKRETSWVGYKVHITETCEAQLPNLITHVETDEAGAADLAALPRIHEALEERCVLPATHLVDTGYVDAGELARSEESYGVALVGPARGDSSWQAREAGAYTASSFHVDWEREEVTCPQGTTSTAWQHVPDAKGGEVIKIKFAEAHCRTCESKAQCTRAPRRMLSIRPRRQAEALEAARAREHTEAFRKQYRARAGVEGTISQAVRAFGMRRARYVGYAKTRLQHVLTAAAINLVRINAWLAESPRARTRRSAFRTLMVGAAA
jgi:transposase